MKHHGNSKKTSSSLCQTSHKLSVQPIRANPLGNCCMFSRGWQRFCVFPRAGRHRLHTFPRLATYDWFFVLLACFVIWRLNCQGVVGKWKPLQNRLHLTWIYSAIFKPLAQKQSMTFVFSLYTAFCSRMINIHHVCLLMAVQQHFWLFSPTAHCLHLWLFIVEGTIVW